MFEKVNPEHPDKVADRIAGAIVDLAYSKMKDPRIAVEALLGHGVCNVIIETNADIHFDEVSAIVKRIAGEDTKTDFLSVPQDTNLSVNQDMGVRCGDNGIFRGVPVSTEERNLTRIARDLFARFGTDGKYFVDGNHLTICQSCASHSDIYEVIGDAYKQGRVINPLGHWTGGISVDTGAVNRKLGSDMGNGVTGGGLHGKDLSKADVSLNIYAFLKAQITGDVVELSCSIGDDMVDGRTYAEIVDIARRYICAIGGFEKFAEWGLIR